VALSVFDDKSRVPQDGELAAMLGGTFVFWNELKRLIGSRFTPLSIEWGFTSEKTGGNCGSSGRSEPFST
jgi:hypothetical protein